MRRPSAADLPEPWLRVARQIAETLAARGHRAWIVGGCVRDLALSRQPSDVDMACAAPPEEVEAAFARTMPVGKAFGTVVVHLEQDVQVTTFRSESGYSDQRRPDQVAWGATPEEDSERRDFTCNALYLDPLDDTLLDPHGGLADLERGLLRTVGDPAERFREDGLRLVRMARFAAQFGLAVDPATFAAATAERSALSGVSPERVLHELDRILLGPAPGLGLTLLREAQLLGLLLPGSDALWSDGGASHIAALERLGPHVGTELGLAALLAPAAASDAGTAEELLVALRPSRELRRGVTELWRLERAARATPTVTGAARVRLVRAERWPSALRLARARHGDAPALEELEQFAAGLSEAERFPAPLLAAADLEARGVPRSARWGEVLRELEDLQLERTVTTRDQALAWLKALPLES